MKKSEKRDGRKTVRHSGVFPYKLRESQRRTVIKDFQLSGKSVHGPSAFTLGVILEYCIAGKVPFTLRGATGQGFVITKGIQSKLPDIFDGAAGKVIHQKLSTLSVSNEG